ncbi:MAG: L-threonylcarbamoyladenylate synthase [Dehalococcoidia bacterium]
MPRMPDNLNNRSVAAILLREGGVIAYPTDTVYGLGAVVFRADAVGTMFVIKGRARQQGVPVLIASDSQLREVAVDVPDTALALADRFWPGQLTLVLPRHPRLPLAVTGGGPTVAVRLPDHPCPQSLISACGAPITGTSANKHGGPDPLSAEEVQRQLGHHVGLILDGGPSVRSVASTIIDMTTVPPRLLRAGAVALDDLRTVCEVASPAPVETGD